MVVTSETPMQQPAELYLLGSPALPCTITELTASQACVHLNSAETAPALKTEEPAEIHVNIGAELLKIRVTISAIQHNTLFLSHHNVNDPSLRRLINWFCNNPLSTVGEQGSTAILVEAQDLFFAYFEQLFNNYLEQTDLRLLKLAEAASSNQQQGQLIEAKSLLRQNHSLLRSYCLKYIRQFFIPSTSASGGTPLGPTASEQVNTPEELALVEEEVFEELLALDVIVKRATDYYGISLACLEKRFSILLEREITADSSPVGVRVITAALHFGLQQYNLPESLHPTLYYFFEEIVIKKLDDVYDNLNILLKNHGIAPGAETDIMRQLGQVKRRPESYHSEEDEQVATAEPAVATPSSKLSFNQAPRYNPAVYSTAKQVLALLGEHRLGEQPSAENYCSPEELLDSLSQLQTDTAAMASIAEGGSLYTWVQDNQVSLAPETTDLIKLVSDIFSTLKEYSQIPPGLVTLLQKLQIPIAKTALLDDGFFASHEHPARQFLNQLIELSITTDAPARTLEKQFSDIIAGIDNNVELHPETFSRALQQLQTVAEQQQRTFVRNADRVTQTYEGRQRVQIAEQAVEQALALRLPFPETPEIILELLDNGWRELLKLTYINGGPDSSEWSVYLDHLDQLILWLQEAAQKSAEQQENFYKEQEADAFVDGFLKALNATFPGDYRYQDTVEKIRHTLSGKHPVVMTHADASNYASTPPQNNELIRELEAANPELERWFKRAKSLQVGDEFCYLNDKSGKNNIKLAWVSENKQHFVFVNNRGHKVFDFDLVDLASELSKGLTPVDEQTSWPLVENSLYSSVQHAYEQLAYSSTHDELTGLVNRKECDRLLNAALIDAKNNRVQYCLLYLDLDKFSLVNNLHGHLAGDHILNEISQLLIDASPVKSVIGRMGGDEFILLLSNHDTMMGNGFAQRLLITLEKYGFNWEEENLHFTASIGLVEINKYTQNVVDLLRHATRSCQAAKKGGGNRVVDFRQDAEVHNRRAKLLGWIDQLNTVLNSGQLLLRAQPIQAIEGDKISQQNGHFEILLAIRNEEGGLESPTEFIEAAECYHRMQRVDRWVIENTLIWLKTLARKGKAMPRVSINLSGNSLNDDHFLDFILEQFATHQVPTTQVCFEVTETATITNLAEAADFIREVKKIGCRFSLDDFGSGNASYQYLKHLPVDYLKIDGLFVREIAKNNNDYALVKSIHEIAHLMGMKTIAEFAESEPIIDKLKEIGVDYIQGYAIGKPMLLEQLDIASQHLSPK